MIASFGDAARQDFFHGRSTARTRRYPSDLARTAVRKLDAINAAHVLDDLRAPPGNRLEALKGDLAGRHSIRINSQWRIIFRWIDGAAHDVMIDD
jgi:proteic killer suppression protein